MSNILSAGERAIETAAAPYAVYFKAAAAAVLAIALRPDTRVGPADPGSVAVVVEPHADPEVVVAEDPEVIVASHLGTEVEEVDFGSNIGTVFQVPGEQDVPVAVVWISDEEFVR